MTESIFEDAVNRNSQRLFLIAYSYTQNRSDAEDIMQNTFLKLWNYQKPFNDEKHIDKWLTRVCINESNDIFKSVFRKKSVSLDEANELTHFDKHFNVDLFNAVSSLPKKERVVTHLFYYEDMPIKDISALLSLKESTVKSLLKRSREKLRLRLGDEWIYE